MSAENDLQKPMASAVPARVRKRLELLTNLFLWPGILMATTSIILGIDALQHDFFNSFFISEARSPDAWHTFTEPILLGTLGAIGFLDCVALFASSVKHGSLATASQRSLVDYAKVFAVIGFFWTPIQLFVNLARIH